MKLKLSISFKLFLVFMLLLLASVSFISYFIFHNATKSMQQETNENIQSLLEDKARETEKVFQSHIFNINTFAQLPDIAKLYDSISAYFAYDEIESEMNLKEITKQYGWSIDRITKKYKYNDLLLIRNDNSKVIYSVKDKEAIGRNIYVLGEEYYAFISAWNMLQKQKKVTITDLVFKTENNKEIVSYIGYPIMDDYGNNVASMVLEIPSDAVQTLFHHRNKLKASGQMYLFGSDSLLRVNLEKNDTAMLSLKLPEEYVFDTKDVLNPGIMLDEEVMYSNRKLLISGLDWYVGIAYSKEELQARQKQLLLNLLFIFVGVVSLIGIIAFLLFRNISRPFRLIKESMNELKDGSIPSLVNYQRVDEVGEIVSDLNALIALMDNVEKFAQKISGGDLTATLQKASNKDELAKALIEMKNSLLEAEERTRQREIEDKQRNWASDGAADFSAILRRNNDNIEELSYQILYNLVKYVDANQAGMFFLQTNSDDDVYLELIASYAYERRKFLKKTILPGEGYLGTCLIEKEKIFLTDVPQDYMDITSGLGKENPTCILILPLKFKDEVIGVIEIASFNVFEDYQVEFMEALSESIANTIIAVRNNLRTAQLLKESNAQGEKLKQQEEEMRQNMEEMQATQEELSKEQNENRYIFDAIDKGIIRVEYDMQGKILSANQAFYHTMYLEKMHIMSHSLKDNHEFVGKYPGEEGYKQFWKELKDGKVIQVFAKTIRINQMFKTEILMKEIYVPIRNEYDEIVKVIKLAIDISDYYESLEEISMKRKRM